jgi:small-conductance mechanosensitive channel
MSDPIYSDETASPVRSLRDRLGGNAEERLGKALSELLESPLFTGAIGRAFDAREKAAQAQEVALGALNLPSAADIERLTRRIRSLSQRLEAIEDGVERLDSTRLAARRGPVELEARLEHVEEQLGGLLGKLDLLLTRIQQTPPPAAPAASAAPATGKPTAKASDGRRARPKAAAKPAAARKARPKAAAKPAAARKARTKAAAKPAAARKAEPKGAAKPAAARKAKPKAAGARKAAAKPSGSRRRA